MRNPYMKFQNPSMHSSWRTDGQPKPICTVNLFEVWGIVILKLYPPYLFHSLSIQRFSICWERAVPLARPLTSSLYCLTLYHRILIVFLSCLVSLAGCGIWLYRFLIIAFSFIFSKNSQPNHVLKSWGVCITVLNSMREQIRKTTNLLIFTGKGI